MTNQPLSAPKTLTVEQAGRIYFDLSRASSYAAVARGDIPTIRVGKLLRVPVAAMERMMMEAGQKPATAGAMKAPPFGWVRRRRQ